MKKILFMEDSITDAGRNRDEGTLLYMGQRYLVLCAGRILKDNPGEFEVDNKGISGHRIVDIYARIKKGFLDIEGLNQY